eukprot:gene887-414_t
MLFTNRVKEYLSLQQHKRQYKKIDKNISRRWENVNGDPREDRDHEASSSSSSGSSGSESSAGPYAHLSTQEAIEAYYSKMQDSAATLMKRPKRSTEFSKILPVVFVVFLIITLWAVYLFYHLFPLLGVWDKKTNHDDGDFTRGLIECIIFHIFLLMLIVNYVLAIFTDAGSVPDTPAWTVTHDSESPADEVVSTYEKKRTGERRHCNHKYFFLLLLYATLTTHFMAWTLIESVKNALDVGDSFFKIFCLLFGITFSAFLAVLITSFFGFHIWLAFHGMTTIEFCEKSLNSPSGEGYKSQWDRGCWGNAKAILGKNPMFWLCPFGSKDGDGIKWQRKEMNGMESEDAEETIEEERKRLLADSKLDGNTPKHSYDAFQYNRGQNNNHNAYESPRYGRRLDCDNRASHDYTLTLTDSDMPSLIMRSSIKESQSWLEDDSFEVNEQGSKSAGSETRRSQW